MTDRVGNEVVDTRPVGGIVFNASLGRVVPAAATPDGPRCSTLRALCTSVYQCAYARVPTWVGVGAFRLTTMVGRYRSGNYPSRVTGPDTGKVPGGLIGDDI